MNCDVKKRWLFIALCVLFAALAAITAAAGILYTSAADGAAIQQGTFAMTEGAALKLNEQGIRFRVKMDKYFYDVLNEDEESRFYFLITDKESFDAQTAAGGNYAEKAGSESWTKIDGNKADIYSGGADSYYANACISGIEDVNYKTYYVGIACAEIAVDGSDAPVTRYAALDAENSRGSLYDLVNTAMLYGEKDYTDALQTVYGSWYGSENYPIVIKSTENYNTFVAKINAGKDFSANYVVIYSTVDRSQAKLDEGKQLPANTTDFAVSKVTFYDDDRTKILQETSYTGTQTVTPPLDPTKADTEEYAYVFDKWLTAEGEEASFENLSGNVSFYASYKSYALNKLVSVEAEDFEDTSSMLVSDSRIIADKAAVYTVGEQTKISLTDTQSELPAGGSGYALRAEMGNQQFIAFKYTGIEAGKTYYVDFDMKYTDESSTAYSFWINENAEPGTATNRLATVYDRRLETLEGGGTTPRGTSNGTDHYSFSFVATQSGYIYCNIRCNVAAGDVAVIDNFRIFAQESFSEDLSALGISAHDTAVQMTYTFVNDDRGFVLSAQGGNQAWVVFNIGAVEAGKTYVISFKVKMYLAAGSEANNAYAFGISNVKTYNAGASYFGDEYKFKISTPGEDATLTFTLTVGEGLSAENAYFVARSQADGNCIEIWDFTAGEQTVAMGTVSFDAGGGTAVSPQEVRIGAKIEEPAVPVKASTAYADYIFDGWYCGDEKWNFETDVVSELTMTLTAKWITVEYTEEFLPSDL